MIPVLCPLPSRETVPLICESITTQKRPITGVLYVTVLIQQGLNSNADIAELYSFYHYLPTFHSTKYPFNQPSIQPPSIQPKENATTHPFHQTIIQSTIHLTKEPFNRPSIQLCSHSTNHPFIQLYFQPLSIKLPIHSTKKSFNQPSIPTKNHATSHLF